MFEYLQEQMEEIKATATELRIPQWAEQIEEWHQRVARGEEWIPAKWYLTDLRHLHNLTSPQWQGYITPETPPKRTDQMNHLSDLIQDYIDSHFEDNC